MLFCPPFSSRDCHMTEYYVIRLPPNVGRLCWHTACPTSMHHDPGRWQKGFQSFRVEHCTCMCVI